VKIFILREKVIDLRKNFLMSHTYRFLVYNWQILVMHFLLPIILLRPSMWCLEQPYTEMKEINRWIKCKYNVAFEYEHENDVVCANISGYTLNSSMCNNIELQYINKYCNNVSEELNDVSEFRSTINNMFPANKVINCTVDDLCRHFDYYVIPEYKKIVIPTGLVALIFGSIMTSMIIVLPIMGVYYTRLKWNHMLNIKELDKLMPL